MNSSGIRVALIDRDPFEKHLPIKDSWYNSLHLQHTSTTTMLGKYIPVPWLFPSAPNILLGSMFRYPFNPQPKTTTAEGSSEHQGLGKFDPVIQ